MPPARALVASAARGAWHREAVHAVALHQLQQHVCEMLHQALLWNKNEKELLSAYGFVQKPPLTLWKYPSMVRLAELEGHTSHVLSLAQSPDGFTVASAAADETLRLWNVFGTSKAPRPAAKTVKLWDV